MQQDMSYTINRYIPTSKGSFKPWAVLTAPELTRAYRFVYPNLLVAGSEKAYVWDVLTCDMALVVPDIQAVVDGENLGRINYVELSPLHVLICGTRQLRLFDRTTGALAYHIKCSRLPPWSSLEIVSIHPTAHASPNNDLQVLPLCPEGRITRVSKFNQFIAGISFGIVLLVLLTIALASTCITGR